jgi:hypothetical protein
VILETEPLIFSLAEGDGVWLRCALHAHTTRSDGELDPRHLVRHYERARYDVLAVTDHWARTSPESTAQLLVVPGAELDAAVAAAGREAHVLALGIDADPQRPGDGFDGLAETVAWIEANGGVAYLSHPRWSGLRTSDFEGCDGLAGIEIYNAGCELEIGRGLSSGQWDEALERGILLYGIATDDSHHPGYDSGYAWVWARCRERSHSAVLEALGAGRFYSSTGPTLHEVSLEDESVVVRCSAARSVTLVSDPRRGARVNAGRLGYQSDGAILATDDAGAITAAQLRRSPRAVFGRVEVEDAQGRRAWTNPLWLTR